MENEEQELGNQGAVVGAISLCLVSAATFAVLGWWLVPIALGAVVLGLLLYRGGPAAGRRPTVLILGLGVLAGPVLYGLAALVAGFISAVF